MIILLGLVFILFYPLIVLVWYLASRKQKRDQLKADQASTNAPRYTRRFKRYNKAA